MARESGFKSRLARSVTGTAVITIVALVVIGVFQYLSVRDLVDATRAVDHTDMVTFRLNSARSNLRAAYDAVHARILGGQPSSEDGPTARLAQDLDRVRTLASDNASQQGRLARIDSLLQSQQKLREELLAMQASGPSTSDALNHKLNEYDQVGSQVDGTLGDMLNEEGQLMRWRTQAVRRAEARTIGVGSVTLLVLIIGVLATRGSHRARLIVEAEVMRLNRELEQRVTERTREVAEQAELLDVAHDAILVRTLEGTIQFWNKGAESIYGWSKAEAVGKVSHTLLQTEFPQPMQQIQETLQRTRTWEGELKHVRRDGPAVYVASRWVLQQTANGPRVLEINTDITAGKQAQRTEERFRLLVEGVKDYGIFLLDPMGHVTTWNDGAQRIKGYRAEEIIGQHFSRFYPQVDNDRGKPAYELKAAAEEGRFEDEGWRLRKDGSRFWANVIITPLRDPDGRLLGFSKITRDLTERKMAEDRIAALNAEIMERNEGLVAANRELESFSYSVSHDLRAPLRSIDGFSAALLEDYADKLDDQGKSYLQRIRTAATRMGHLIDDMIKLARTARVEMSVENVNLSLLAEEISHQLRMIQPERKAEFRIQPDLAVQGDRTLLRSVLENLLENAWKFTAKKPHAVIEVGAQKRGHDVAYFVRDNGAGFDMRYVNKLFGVFQRLHNEKDYSGTGVGLATVQRIIQRHGGKIWAEGSPGEGATFYFELPPARTNSGTPEPAVTEKTSGTVRERSQA